MENRPYHNMRFKKGSRFIVESRVLEVSKSLVGGCRGCYFDQATMGCYRAPKCSLASGTPVIFKDVTDGK